MAESSDNRLTFFAEVERSLRGGSQSAGFMHSWAILAISGCLYGAVLGSFGGFGMPRVTQMVFSAVKVPLLLAITFWLSLPSFFIFNTLLGLRADFPTCFKAIAASQSVLGIVLASLAPLTVVWYLSVPDYFDAILFNAGMFVVASVAAQWSLRRAYRPLLLRNRRHRWMLRLWLTCYAFVGIQMAWVLRPFVGDPAMSTTFFRRGAFTNAYVFVVDLIIRKHR